MNHGLIVVKLLSFLLRDFWMLVLLPWVCLKLQFSKYNLITINVVSFIFDYSSILAPMVGVFLLPYYLREGAQQ